MRITDKELRELYTVRHLTMAEIGLKLGQTRQGIQKRIKKLGISARDGEHVKTRCYQCDKEIELVRSRFRNKRKHFCSKACWMLDIGNEAYVQHRWSGMQARKIVSKYFALRDHHIVHHKDSNQRNNSLNNLAVFASQADHLRHHHGAAVPFLWDGAELSSCVAE